MGEGLTSQEAMGSSPMENGRTFLAAEENHHREIGPMAKQLAALFERPDGQMALVQMLRAAADRPDYREQMKERD